MLVAVFWLIVGFCLGVFCMGLFSSRAYQKGREDLIDELEFLEQLKNGGESNTNI